MLAKDQLRMIAQEIDRTADERMHDCVDEYDRQQLWEVVRRASHVIETVAEMERDELTRFERSRRARYLVTELEIALDAAQRARIVLDWTSRER
jgi:hypothetical protein